MTVFFIGEISPQSEINYFLIRKTSDFRGFQSPEIRMGKEKIARFIYLVFIIYPKIQKVDQIFLIYFLFIARFG